jgi:hypothetical protein
VTRCKHIEEMRGLLRWLLVLPGAILGGLIAMVLSGLACIFFVHWLTAFINATATAVAFVTIGAGIAPRFRMAVAISLALAMGTGYSILALSDWQNDILTADKADAVCCFVGMIFGLIIGCRVAAEEK